MLALRKARGIVRCWKGWWSDNPSGSRPNFFGRQHLTFDKGRAWMPEVERPEFRKDAKPTERSYGKCDGAKQGIVRFWKVMRGEGFLRNPSGSRPNFFGRQHLTFNKGGKCGGAKQGIVRKISLMVGMGSNHHHSWLGLTVQQNLTLLNVRG